uniref:PPM-type phosphatase domain-containing protein n=1 Tax=Clastoptera arizonana TaxID=38151 RepID=A0A1B6DPK3_9HEMI
MEDELEDKIFYQTYSSHMKLFSKFIVGLPLNSTYFGYVWRMLRLYILKPEVIFCSLFLIIILFYLQTLDLWSRSLLGKLHFSLGRSASKVQKLQFFVSTNDVGKSSWELKENSVAAFAVQGRRPKMEDRFVVNENIDKTGVSLYAVFDGHGGEFAANYARDNLVNNLNNKVIELKKLISKGVKEKSTIYVPSSGIKYPSSPRLDSKKLTDNDGVRKQSFRKTASQTDECYSKKTITSIVTDPLLLEKLDSLNRPITREVRPTRPGLNVQITAPAVETYLDSNYNINYGRLLTDEVLAADRLLVEAAKKTMDVAGTTALIALIEGSQLIVANVGDSRGVMCDSKGNAIPLSFDHKPQQVNLLLFLV